MRCSMKWKHGQNGRRSIRIIAVAVETSIVKTLNADRGHMFSDPFALRQK